MIVTFLRDLFGGCRETPPDSREAVGEVKDGSKRSDKYDSDVKALKERYRIEFETGVCIELELSELLEILPRERRRKDAYDKLVKFLAEEMNMRLTIHTARSQITVQCILPLYC